jgi:hypothetical protein
MGDNYGTLESEDRGYVPALDTIAPGIIDQARAVAVEGEDWVSAVSRAMTTVAMADYQRRLLNVQLERARQGLPPLAASDYGVGVSVGIDPATRNMLLIGGAALIVVLLLARRRA